MPSIRKAEPAAAHEQRLLRLFEQQAEDLTHPRAVLANGNYDLWLAEDGEALVGALLGTHMHVTSEGVVVDATSSAAEVRGGVENLLVAAPHRRQGIGRALMETAESHYAVQGLAGMQLAADADNVPARLLYESMGYRIIREYVRTRAGVQQPRISMAKQFPTHR